MLFNDLTPEQQAVVERSGTIRKFKPGEMVIKEGEVGSALFVVKSGKVEVRKDISADNYKALKELGAMEFFGEMSFLGVSERSANVVAVEPTEILELRPEDLEVMTWTNPKIGLQIYRNIACELAIRLKRNTDELKKALRWVMQEP